MNEIEIAFVFGAVGLALGVLLGRIWAFGDINAQHEDQDVPAPQHIEPTTPWKKL